MCFKNGGERHANPPEGNDTWQLNSSICRGFQAEGIFDGGEGIFLLTSQHFYIIFTLTSLAPDNLVLPLSFPRGEVFTDS